jgi:type II secretory pathway component PulC
MWMLYFIEGKNLVKCRFLFQNLIASRVWEIKLSHGSQRITAVISKSSIEKVHSQGRVLGDRSVLYKYINPNLVAVLTQGFDPVHKRKWLSELRKKKITATCQLLCGGYPSQFQVTDV